MWPFNHKYKAGDRRKYRNLDMDNYTAYLLDMDNPAFVECCNGVGSEVGLAGLAYHIIPDTIWGMNITDVSDIHDVEYTYPELFSTVEEAKAFKISADKRFIENLLIRIQERDSIGFIERGRTIRAYSYYQALKRCGMDSFLENKTILNR